MITGAEERMRTLLHAAAPEPTHTLDGLEIRRAADESPGDVPFPAQRRSRSTTLSATLVAAAIVLIVLLAVGMAVRNGHRSAPAADPRSAHNPSASGTRGPPDCARTLVLVAGPFTGRSGGDGAITLTIRNSQRSLCTLPRVPAISLTFDGLTISALPASRYEPPSPLVVGQHQSVRVVVALHAVHTCDGLGAGNTKIVFALNGSRYGFQQHLDGCQYTIASARVHRGD